VSAPLASASVESQVTIDSQNGPPSVFGKVRSPRHACEKQRRVRLAYNDGGGFQLVGADNTKDRGHWQLFYNGGITSRTATTSRS
jgi:hypothetical protein